MVANIVKTKLKNAIDNLDINKSQFLSNSQKDFSRNRKLSFKDIITSILSFTSKTLTIDLLEFFGFNGRVATSSAFIQQRAKISYTAFESLFHNFTSSFSYNNKYKGFRLLAIDGSDLETEPMPDDSESFFPGKNGAKSYNLYHINAMYDLIDKVYTDVVIQKRRKANESAALVEMVERSNIKKYILIADRGYESYNNIAHIQEKGEHFLFRIKNGTGGIVTGLDLPDLDEFDVNFNLNFTNSNSKEVRELLQDREHYKLFKSNNKFDYLPQNVDRNNPTFFNLRFRIVRFPISDSNYETIITNLDPKLFPANEIKKLYGMRWGIETSFRYLKYTLGLRDLYSRKTEFIYQEIFANFIMYNYCRLITRAIIVKQNKKMYPYTINFSVAVSICRKFFRDLIPPSDVEPKLSEYISPNRPGRTFPRKIDSNNSTSFNYRVS